MSQVYINVPKQIIKRDGSIVEFDAHKITTALRKCFTSIGIEPKSSCEVLTDNVLNVVGSKYSLPSVEKVQDVVELVLQSNGEYVAAKEYILYRNKRNQERTQRHVPDVVKQAFDADDVYFPTALQKFQFYDKYSRFNYELGRRETWVETVDRTISFLRELSENKLDDVEYERLRNGILNMQVMPSMRLLAMAGDAARRNNIALYNCSYMVVDSIHAFVEALIISMNGCGVGFSVERHHVEKLPRIKRQAGVTPITFVVEDTAEGWAGALRYGLQTWFDGSDVVFDFSLVRKAGEPLKTKGGRASGPDPLRKMLRFARERILAKQGSFLSSLDAHDIMCEVGNAAVAGGVRRTAMISLFDYDDYEMRHCKDGDFSQHNSQRWNANNSAVWPERQLSQQEITRFMLDMVESGRGEPGIYNRRAANLTKPERRQEWEFGGNPCVTGDPWVMTNVGPHQVHELVGKQFTAVVNGMPYQSTEQGFFFTGNKQVYEIKTVEGYTLKATANHPILKAFNGAEIWTNVDELQIGDAVYLHDHDENVWPYNHVNVDKDDWERQSSRYYRYFLTQLIENNHTVTVYDTNDVSLILELPLFEYADIQKVQRMLLRLGVISKIHHDVVNCLLIDNAHLKTLVSRLGLISKHVNMFSDYINNEIEKLPYTGDDDFLVTIESITPLGIANVFDCTIPEVSAFDANGFYVHNCNEIVLRGSRHSGDVETDGGQFCNLTSVVSRQHDTPGSLKDKVEMAAILGTIQSMAEHFPGLRQGWVENCRDERLLGVDLNGQMDSLVVQDPDVQEMLRDIAVATNKKYAERLGINQSAAVTCVKPSGNSSQLLNSSSGLHARWSQYYIRHVRVGVHSPLYKVLKDAGVKMNPENGQTAQDATTYVVAFPVKSPDGAITRNERTALEQCNYWLQNKLKYTEHNGSITISYKPDEVIDLIKWVYEHQDVIGGMAFLPSFDAQYEQMPYEEISEERYNELASQFPEIDFSKIYLYEEMDLTTAAQEVACSAGNCDI